jgi:hypothetical protein
MYEDSSEFGSAKSPLKTSRNKKTPPPLAVRPMLGSR